MLNNTAFCSIELHRDPLPGNLLGSGVRRGREEGLGPRAVLVLEAVWLLQRRLGREGSMAAHGERESW